MHEVDFQEMIITFRKLLLIWISGNAYDFQET